MSNRLYVLSLIDRVWSLWILSPTVRSVEGSLLSHDWSWSGCGFLCIACCRGCCRLHSCLSPPQEMRRCVCVCVCVCVVCVGGGVTFLRFCCWRRIFFFFGSGRSIRHHILPLFFLFLFSSSSFFFSFFNFMFSSVWDS